jgi:hypothetical protein
VRVVVGSVVLMVLGGLDVVAIRDIVAGGPDLRFGWGILAVSAMVFTGLLSRALGRAAARGDNRPSLH